MPLKVDSTLNPIYLLTHRRWFLIFNLISRTFMIAAYVAILTSLLPYYARLIHSLVQFLYISAVFIMSFIVLRGYDLEVELKPGYKKVDNSEYEKITTRYPHLMPMRRVDANRSARFGSRRNLTYLPGSERGMTEYLPLKPAHVNWGRP